MTEYASDISESGLAYAATLGNPQKLFVFTDICWGDKTRHYRGDCQMLCLWGGEELSLEKLQDLN